MFSHPFIAIKRSEPWWPGCNNTKTFTSSEMLLQIHWLAERTWIEGSETLVKRHSIFWVRFFISYNIFAKSFFEKSLVHWVNLGWLSVNSIFRPPPAGMEVLSAGDHSTASSMKSPRAPRKHVNTDVATSSEEEHEIILGKLVCF